MTLPVRRKSPLIFRKQHLDPYVERCKFEPHSKPVYTLSTLTKENSRRPLNF